MKDAALCCVFRFSERVQSMRRTTTAVCLCVVCITVVFLFGCGDGGGDLGLETLPEEFVSTGTTRSTAQERESVTIDERTTEPATKPVPATTVPTTVPASKPSTTDYVEWTYQGEEKQIIPGYRIKSNVVTYTENPKNPYIVAVSEQLSIPAERFSASFYDAGAVVFQFSSSNKNKDTLVDCHFIFSDKMEIEKRKDGTIGNNKALADPLYERTMMKKP